MYVTRQLTDLSFPVIAREFGGRDHTTVMHACDKISALMHKRDPDLQRRQRPGESECFVPWPRLGTTSRQPGDSWGTAGENIGQKWGNDVQDPVKDAAEPVDTHERHPHPPGTSPLDATGDPGRWASGQSSIASQQGNSVFSSTIHSTYYPLLPFSTQQQSIQ